MNALKSLPNLVPNANWASLPLFDRTGWRRMAFGDFAESIGVRAEPKDAQDEIYVGLEHLDPQCLHIRRWGKGSDVTGTKLRFRKGDIIFGRRRAYQRKLAVAEFDGICSAHAMVVRAKSELVLPEFLPFLMMSDRFMNRAVEISVGSLSPTINWTTLKLEEFDLPPLDQQRRIAEMLWAVDEDRQGWLETQASAVVALDAFIEYSLAKFDLSDRKIPLNQMINPERPLCYGIVQPGEVSKDGTPFIRVCDIEAGVINVAGLMRVSDEVNRQYRRSIVAVGDILVSIVGTIGRVVIVGAECQGFNIARAVARLAPSSFVLSEFLAFLLCAPSTQRRLVGSSFESARKTLNLSALEALEFPLPDLVVQREFMTEIAMRREVVNVLEAKAAATQTLQKAMVSQVFL